MAPAYIGALTAGVDHAQDGPRPAGGGLFVRADPTLPAELPAGTSTAILCSGSCFHPRQQIERLELRVGARRHTPGAWRMPRMDLFRELHPAARAAGAEPPPADPDSVADPELRCYRSGFWATIPIEALGPESVLIEVVANLEGGGEVSAPFAEIAVDESPEASEPEVAPPPRIAICMATFDPDEELLRRQLDSIRAQSLSEAGDWICLISDDCSAPERFAMLERAVHGDSRFVLSRSPRRIGFYRNFERALRMVPTGTEMVALSDQDDRWYPEKLATLRDALGEAQLVYSDQRLVDRSGRVLRDTLWKGRRNNHTSFASILIANTIVGASTMFRRGLLDDALPFPKGPGWEFHDHWLAVVAMASGPVRYVDQPLYDYVQHSGAIVSRVGVQGADDAGRPWHRVPRPSELRGLFARWRHAYFRGYLQHALLAQVVLVRRGERLGERERRAARLLIGAERSPLAFAWLLLRPLRALVGRTETLGSELHLVRGIAWRRLIALRVGSRRLPLGASNDAAPPPFDVGAIGQRRLRRWLAGS